MYPKDPKVDIHEIANFKEDGYALTLVTLTMHTDTHLDAPSHLSKSTTQASDFPIELMVSDACVLDISQSQDIHLNDQAIKLIQEHNVVFLYTGWSIYYGSERYFKHPVLTVETAQRLIDAGVKVIVVDTPSVDNAPYPIHQLLFSHGIWIVENVRIDQQVLSLEKFTAIIAPIKIEAEAALTRVLVMEKDA